MGEHRLAGAGRPTVARSTETARSGCLAPTIRKLMAAGFVSQRNLTGELNRRGIPSARGGKWHRTSIARVLIRLGFITSGRGNNVLALKIAAEVRAKALGPGLLNSECRLLRRGHRSRIKSAKDTNATRWQMAQDHRPPTAAAARKAGSALEPTNLTVAAMTWNRFLDAYSRPHLVVAWLHGAQRAGEARGRSR